LDAEAFRRYTWQVIKSDARAPPDRPPTCFAARWSSDEAPAGSNGENRKVSGRAVASERRRHMSDFVNEPAPGFVGQGEASEEGASGYTPREWERVVDGVLEGPGYAVDLETGDLLWFVSPGLMRQMAPKRQEGGSQTTDDGEPA
jgi:hypothetical protein